MVIDRLLTFYGFSFSGRTRTKDKYRVVYSDHQRLELEKEFHYSRYITIRRKAELANSVGLSERQVRISQFFCFCFLSTSMRDASSEYLSLLCITIYAQVLSTIERKVLILALKWEKPSFSTEMTGKLGWTYILKQILLGFRFFSLYKFKS